MLNETVSVKFSALASEYIQENEMKKKMVEFDTFKEKNKLFNWFKNFTLIQWPQYFGTLGYLFLIRTTATEGHVVSPGFGDEFIEKDFMKEMNAKLEITLPDKDFFIGVNLTFVVIVTLDLKESSGEEEHIWINIQNALSRKKYHHTGFKGTLLFIFISNYENHPLWKHLV